MADAGGTIWGSIGREIVGIAQPLLLVFFMSSHILTFSILLNVITGHTTCSIIFGVVGLVITFLMTLPRTGESVLDYHHMCVHPNQSNRHPVTCFKQPL